MRWRCGVMALWDTPDHDWLEGRGPRMKLTRLIDDATIRRLSSRSCFFRSRDLARNSVGALVACDGVAFCKEWERRGNWCSRIA